MTARDPQDPFEVLPELLGLSWGDISNAGKTAFPYVHQAGAGVLNAFGAGGVVKPLETLETRGGLLPEGAPSAAAPGGRVAPGAMPMTTSASPGKPTSPLPPVPKKPPQSFLERYEKSIKYAAVAAVVVGALGLMAQRARRK